LEIEIEKLKVDQNNTNGHDAKNINHIKQSLKTFGQQRDILVRETDHVIIAGNGTYIAAKELGWKTIGVKYSKLNDVMARAYSIADNQIARTSNPELEQMAKEIKTLEDEFKWSAENNWEALGFDKQDIELLIQAGNTFEGEINTEKNTEISEKPKPKTIKLTDEQYEVFKQAADKIRTAESDQSISDGRICEFVCADFLSAN
jgi:ParB-like chromosome segregation protein Spo0J